MVDDNRRRGHCQRINQQTGHDSEGDNATSVAARPMPNTNRASVHQGAMLAARSRGDNSAVVARSRPPANRNYSM
ncbi:hypothetical protein [Halorhabdus salina]|uniref:hypothetical protein n=1 Tax=Halorhabdus salina TaxID=2750670 RepID=UPI0015EE3B76|nr:hypothetical protein [Halorhabdus salina]